MASRRLQSFHGDHWKITIIQSQDIMRCPFVILRPEHYREDGSCKCNDHDHQKYMISNWGYQATDFEEKGLL